MERVRATPAAKVWLLTWFAGISLPEDINGGNFVPKPDLTRYDSSTRNCFVAWNNSLPGAVVTDFVTRWSMVLLSTQIAAEGREGA